MNKTKLFLLVLICCIIALSPPVFAAAGDMTVSGKVTAASFTGDGSGLTNISPDNIYMSTVIVSPIGTVSQNGDTLRSALAGITTADAANPILLKIEPGNYGLGSTGITMKEYVDIAGSGEKMTKITSSNDSATSGTIKGANNAELRFLTVENVCTGNCSAIYNNAASPSIFHVTALASGGSNPIGIANQNASPTIRYTTTTAFASTGNYAIGIDNYNSSPAISYTTASATSGAYANGIYNTDNSNPTISYTTATATGGITASYGIYNFESSPTLIEVNTKAKSGASNHGMQNVADSGSYIINIDRSIFEGAEFSIINESEYTVNITTSKLVGAFDKGNPEGSASCVGVAYYDGTSVFSAVPSDCSAPPPP